MLNCYQQIIISRKRLGQREMLKKILKERIRNLDLFAQPATFRYGQEPQYQSLTGGIISIIMIIVFVCIFSNTVFSTINRSNVSAKITYVQDENPTYFNTSVENFMFAVGFQNISYFSGKKYFDIYFEKKQYFKGSKIRKFKKLNLTKCNKEQWKKIKPSMEQVYDNLKFDHLLCPSPQTILELSGKFSSQQFKFYKIAVKVCNQSQSDLPCANQTEYQQFMRDNDDFKFNFYYLNTVLNPENSQYIGTYLDDLNYFSFTLNNGVSTNFFLSTYSIKTDNSIFPYQSFSSDNGTISTTPARSINYQFLQGDLVKFYIRKSPLSILIDRSFQKIDDTMSYIGGLFSAFIILLFSVSKYNQICYELEVAKNLFHYDKNRPLKSDQFNFFVFLGYVIYAFFQLIFLKLPWDKMKSYHESLDQVRKQMDIRLIMKKILYAERMAIAVFDQPKAKILHLQEPITLAQAEEIRKDHRFYQKLQKKFFDYKKIRQLKPSQQNPGMIDNNIPLTNIGKKNIQSSQCIKETIDEGKQTDRPINNMLSSQPKQTIQLQKRKTFIQKINEKLDVEAQKEKQFEDMICKMKGHIRTLQIESQRGDILSKKILNRFDPKLMQILVDNNHPSLQNRESPYNLRLQAGSRKEFSFLPSKEQEPQEENQNKQS